MKRVAVIAVHGVGHHNPLEAAKATADLLACGNPGKYSPFVESPLRIPVSALEVGGEVSHRAAGVLNMFEERPAFVRGQHGHEAPDIEYMREQLSAYRADGGDCVYETVSLRATRRDAASGGATTESEVHVYDMYWTDISRVSTAGLRMLGELYQLLFYVCGLGRHTLDFASHKYGTPYWSFLALLQRYAERLLVIWIPLANLCALGLAVLVIPQTIYRMGDTAPWAAAALLAFVFGLGTCAALRVMNPFRGWPWAFWIALFVAPTAGWLAASALAPYLHYVLALAFWVLVAVAILALMRLYDRSRPGAFGSACVAVAIVTLMLVCPIVTRAVDGLHVAEIGLRAGRWLYEAMHLLWVAFVSLAVAVSVMGFFSPRDAQNEARRSVWTANLSLVVPGLLTLLLNLAAWRGCLKLAEKYLDVELASRIKEIIDVSTPWLLIFIIALVVAAFLSVVWSLLPSIVAEIRPKAAASGPADAVGRSLTSGFHAMRVAGEIVRWCVILFLPVAGLFAASRPEMLQHLSEEATFWLGIALVAMVLAPGPLRSLALGMRMAIDVAIDVANWLRLHPLDRNPRARICARFASLLDNILRFQGADDRSGFDRIVIFAHSQGTVIASELLRYLHLTNHPLAARLAGRDVHLFTMGCPLRQLYSQRFPLHYSWGRHGNGNTWPAGEPDPAQLGVSLWCNAYRSGDYVGRYLWFSDGDAAAWQSSPQSGRSREELCIGAGGHTHYWDDTAPAIAARLDGYLG